jgi:predicted DNA-binding protein with PD1-like motif
MQYGVEEKAETLIIKLDKGEWLMESLTKILTEQDIKHGLVLQGIGMLDDIEIGFYDGQSHRTRTINAPHELITLGGTVAQYEGDYSIHLHVSLGATNGNVVGGHLKDGKVAVVAEIIIQILDDVVLARKLNTDSNLAELDIR